MTEQEMNFTDKQMEFINSKNRFSFKIYKDIYKDPDVSFKDVWKSKWTSKDNSIFYIWGKKEVYYLVYYALISMIAGDISFTYQLYFEYFYFTFFIFLITITNNHFYMSYNFLKKNAKKLASLEKEL